MMLETEKRQCVCGWRGTVIELTVSQRDKTKFTCCPDCGFDEEVEHICDEPSCERVASCGVPVNPANYEGVKYRHTCGPHMPSLSA